MYKNLLFTFVALGIALYAINQTSTQGQKQVIMTQQEANQSCSNDCCGRLPSRLPMTYTFYQKTGRFVGGSGVYTIDTFGYSGQGEGYLNPDKQCESPIGPLPAAKYKIGYCKNVMHITRPRPCSFYLAPQEDPKMCGRGDFFIHGCDCCNPGDSMIPPPTGCSEGCIVINYQNRQKLRVGDTIIVQHYQNHVTKESKQ